MGCTLSVTRNERSVSMALSNTERQRRYRSRIQRGELQKVHVVLPGEVGAKLNYLTAALNCSKAELLGRIILEEWIRQGQPISKRVKRR